MPVHNLCKSRRPRCPKKRVVHKRQPWDSEDEEEEEAMQSATWWEKTSVTYAHQQANTSTSSSPIAPKPPPTAKQRSKSLHRPKTPMPAHIAATKHVQWSAEIAATIRHDFPPLDDDGDGDGGAMTVAPNWAERKLQHITDRSFDNYVNSMIECSFNYPRVTAQMKRLMGTNIVRLTDRKYMVDLRRRIVEDCAELQTERIKSREFTEAEREMNLIIKGSYTPENCPPHLVIVHSISLAAEMERQRNLIMQEGTVRCPPEYDRHPVFVANQKTNEEIAQRRSKMRTSHERNCERLIRMGAKWERDRCKVKGVDELMENARQERLRAQREQQDQFNADTDARGPDLRRIKNANYTECEYRLRDFLHHERFKMLTRTTPLIRKKYEELIKEEAAAKEADPKEQSAASSYQTMQPCKSSMEKLIRSEGMVDKSGNATVLHPEETGEMSESEAALAHAKHIEQVNEFLRVQRAKCLQDGYMLPDEDFQRLHWEDPLVTELKLTNTVQDMYGTAEEILCSLYFRPESVAGSTKSLGEGGEEGEEEERSHTSEK